MSLNLRRGGGKKDKNKTSILKEGEKKIKNK